MAAGGVFSQNSFDDRNILSNSLLSTVSVPNSSPEISYNVHQPITNVELVKNLSSEYAGLIDIHCGKESEHFSETVEELLTKLDELLGFADLIRSDDNLALGTTLGSIHSKTQDMTRNFDRIDQLESFITMLKGSLRELELRVDQAEMDLGTLNPIKKVFNAITLPSLFAPKAKVLPSSTRNQIKPTFRPVTVFNSDDVFKKANKTAPDVHHDLLSGDTQHNRQDLLGNIPHPGEPTSADTSGALSDSISINHSDHSTDLTIDEAPTDDIFLLSDPRRKRPETTAVDGVHAKAADQTSVEASVISDASSLTLCEEPNVNALSSSEEVNSCVSEKIQPS